MEIINQILDTDWIQALGWTLLHSMWQGVALALFLAMVLLILKRQSANLRYLAGIFTLGTFVVIMVSTFSLVYESGHNGSETLPASLLQINQNEAAGETIPLMSENEEMLTEDPTSLITYFGQYFEEHLPIIIFFYLIGVLILTMRMLGELVFIQNLRHSRSTFVGDLCQEKVRAIAQQIGINKIVEVKESIHINSPMIAGIFKPIIFLPVGLLVNLPAAQIESVLAHELAHIRRNDYLVNLLQSFLEIMLFFNPAIWWISAFIRSEREHCCDDMAIAYTGDKINFVKTLAKLEEWRASHHNLALAFAGKRKGGVLGRIQRLVYKDSRVELPFRLFWGIAILLLGFTLTAFNEIEVQPEVILTNVSEKISKEVKDTIPEKQEVPSVLENSGPTATFPETGGGKIAVFPASLSSPQLATTPIEVEGQLSPSSHSKVQLATGSPQPVIAVLARDTLPEKLKKIEAEMQALREQFEPRKMAIQTAMLELEKKRYTIEKETQEKIMKEQVNLSKVGYELKKIENARALKQKEAEMAMLDQQRKIMELEHQARELEMQKSIKEEQMNNENKAKIKKEIEELMKSIQQIQQQTMEMEKQMNRQEMNLQKEALTKEKEMQEILDKNELKEYEIQLTEQQAQLNIMKLEDEARILEIQMMELDQAFERKANQLEQKMEKAYREHEQEEY